MRKAPEPLDIRYEDVKDRFTRTVAVAIVLTTLMAAGVEWMRSTAEDEAGKAARSAQVAAAQASAEQSRAVQDANVDFASFGVASDARALQYWTFQKILLATFQGQASGSTLKSLTNELARQKKLADASAANSAMTAVTYGPDADPHYPYHFFADRLIQTDVLAAVRDAWNDHRADWGSRVTDFTAILTLLAVALYLLGLSLSLTVTIRKGLAALGVGLLLVSAGWAGFAEVTTPKINPMTDRQAADAYAAGMESLRTAYLKLGTAGYLDAIKHFNDAIKLRPNFGRAYFELAGAEFAAGSPQRNAIYFSVTDDSHLQLATRDDRKAVELGFTEARPDLAFEEFLLALPNSGRQQDGNLLAQSIADTRTAIDDNSQEPALYYNLAVSLLAAGDASAMPAYAKAVSHTPADDEAVVGSALTDLGTLSDRRPDLSRRVEQIKQFIVAGVWKGSQLPALLNVRITALYRYANELQVLATIPGFDPKRDIANVQFYYQEKSGSRWSALPEISGPISLTANVAAGQDSYYVLRDYLYWAGDCLPVGNFRVEFYINGRLADSRIEPDVPGETSYLGLTGSSFRDVGLHLCRPADWKPASLLSNVGFSEGYVSPGGGPPTDLCGGAAACGAYLFRYQNPTIKASDSLLYSEVTASLVSNEHLLPAKLRATAPSAPYSGHYFRGMQPGYRDDWYDYQGGRALVVAGMLPDHSMVVGLVYGPQSFFDTARAFRIYESLSLTNAPNV